MIEIVVWGFIPFQNEKILSLAKLSSVSFIHPLQRDMFCLIGILSVRS